MEGAWMLIRDWSDSDQPGKYFNDVTTRPYDRSISGTQFSSETEIAIRHAQTPDSEPAVSETRINEELRDDTKPER